MNIDRTTDTDCTLVSLFERQVNRTPEAVAVQFDDQSMTYHALDEHSNRFAHSLIRAGVEPEARVGVCLERSLELLVALLGILKAGAAYVPLDPGNPPRRLADMVADAEVSLIVTDPALSAAVSAGNARLLYLRLASLDGSPARLDAVMHPGCLAYVIFTSGSTGRPKGAMNTHEAVVNRLMWMQQMYQLNSSDRVLQKTPISFDVSVWELFWPLLAGATLVLTRPDEHRDPQRLAKVIAERAITTVHFVPSMLRSFLAEPSIEGRTTTLRRVFCSGEALSPDLVRRFYERSVAPGPHNLYGPTEAAIDVTYYPCPPEVGSGSVVPIGAPIANTRVLILDGCLAATPTGEAGELFIGGLPLARGYAEQPGLTAERFIPSPFDHGARLYRTGDLARWRADGVIEFLGRADEQVKIRGFRIELTEIDSVLAESPLVGHAAVMVREDRPDDRRLVAYVVPRGAEALDRRALRDHVAARMPDYMVPAWYVAVDALPLTLSGKLDRRALPSPTRGDAVMASSDEPLTGPIQEKLAKIWREVLGVSRISADDNFFDLGGQSLTAAYAAISLRKTLGIEMPISVFADNPTLKDAALVIEDQLLTRVESLSDGEARDFLLKDDVIVPLGDGVHPASFGQQRLWFLDRLRPGSPLYNVPLALDIEGSLDTEVLRAVLDTLVARHAALRTRFRDGGEEVHQVVDAAASVPLAVIDLRQLKGRERDAAVDEQVSAEALRPFDLEQGPLLRVRVLRLAEERSVLLLTMHHIVFDGWSIGVLIDELAALYGAACRGDGTPDLGTLAIQYADYAAWQRGHLAGGARDTHLAYWKDRLGGAPVSLDLVIDHARPAVRRNVGDSFDFTLRREASERLTAVSHRHGATRFMTLLAVFQLLMSRYAGVRDVSVGTPVSGRTRPETVGLIGFFVNTLVLRMCWADEPSFTEFLGRVREGMLEAYEHQDVPFEQVVDALNPPRDSSRTPLFQVMFATKTPPVRTSLLPGLSVTERKTLSQVAKFDLIMGWEENPRESGELHGTVEYDVDLFDRVTVERMTRHYLALLESALATPGIPVSQLTHSTPDELALLSQWGTAGGAGRADSVVDVFRSQVTATPDAVALAGEDQAVTFAELNARSESLARVLAERGVVPESVVGLVMQGSTSLVVAMLAVLVAGAAYLPLDPDQPDARLAFMVEDAGAALVLTDRDLTHVGTVPALCIVETPMSAERSRYAFPVVHPEQRACVYYTSGSTGLPKGVELTHRGIVRLVCDAQLLDFSPSDVVSQAMNPAFDAATLEIWGALLNGARLVGIRREEVLAPESLLARIEAEGVTVMLLPTAVLHQCADTDPSVFAALRILTCGGEAADPKRLAAVRKAAPGVRLVNVYGPTEATVVTTTYDFVDAASSTGRVPIGRPVAETRIYVLDAYGHETGIGVPGEVYIGGARLARGYLRRPDLTAERFIPSTFAEGERLYRTGDVARWNEEGELEFLGRVDQQVKINGIRIEPEEIASVLATHRGVRAAFVSVAGHPDSRYLAAYVVAESPDPVEPRELRAYLSARLPDAMVPAWYVGIPELPLTPNGKVDRSALPAPSGRDGSQAGTIYVPPRSPAEKLVAQTWEKILGVSDLSVHDNFFELGGHSLTAMRAGSHLGRALDIKVPIGVLFESQTLKDMALAIEDQLLSELEGMSDEEAQTFLSAYPGEL